MEIPRWRYFRSLRRKAPWIAYPGSNSERGMSSEATHRKYDSCKRPLIRRRGSQTQEGNAILTEPTSSNKKRNEKKILDIGFREEIQVYVRVRISSAMKPQRETSVVCLAAGNGLQLLLGPRQGIRPPALEQSPGSPSGTGQQLEMRHPGVWVAHSWWKSTKRMKR